MGPRRPPEPGSATTLFRALFRAPPATDSAPAATAPRPSGAALRLVLTLDAAADALPWELLADPDAGRPFALRHPIVAQPPRRRRPAPGDRRPVTRARRRGDAAGTTPLDAGREVQGLRDARRRLVESGAIQLRVVTTTSLADLTRALEDGPWHVVH